MSEVVRTMSATMTRIAWKNVYLPARLFVILVVLLGVTSTGAWGDTGAPPAPDAQDIIITPACAPGPNEVGLYVDAQYRGACVRKTLGQYTNPAAVGLPNDAISSVQVGANVSVVLCEHDDYAGQCQTISRNLATLDGAPIGNDTTSSLKVIPRQTYLEPAPSLATWSTPATLALTGCVQGAVGGCPKPANLNPTIAWSSAIKPRMVVPTARVRFGPFRLSHTILTPPDGEKVTVEYSISIQARSPGLYQNDKYGRPQFVGAQAHFVEIGRTSATLSSIGSRDVYVDATVPGVFNAVKMVASIRALGREYLNSSYPANCNNLPTNALMPELLDRPCLQVGVNPLSVVVPGVVPLGIVYDPPGNCSWANLTDKNTAGVTIALQEAQATNRRTLHDTQVFGFSISHSDFSEEQGRGTERSVTATTTYRQDFRTSAPMCSETGAPPTQLPYGPGKGDRFILLVDAPMMYWDTANATNFRSSAVNALNGSQGTVVDAYAWQLATGQGLPPSLARLSQAQRNAILALDPFTDPAWQPGAALPRRFIYITRRETSQFVPIEQRISQAFRVEGEQTLTQATQNRVRNIEEDVPVKYTMKALTFGGGKAAEALAGAFLDYAGRTWGTEAAKKDFKDMKEGLDISLPTLYKDATETTITTSLSRNNRILKSQESEITQEFYVRDTTQPLVISLYYDTLFGTFAFVPTR